MVIVSNAIKNTPAGGKIFITLIEADDFINIEVKDTGVGITDKEIRKEKWHI